MRLEDYEYIENFLSTLRGIGEIVLEDDANDIGKFDRIHHWHIGTLLMLLSDFGIAVSSLYSMLDEEAIRDMGFPIGDEDEENYEE